MKSPARSVQLRITPRHNRPRGGGLEGEKEVDHALEVERRAVILRELHVDAVGIAHPGHGSGADIRLVHQAIVGVVAEGQGICRLSVAGGEIIKVEVAGGGQCYHKAVDGGERVTGERGDEVRHVIRWKR